MPTDNPDQQTVTLEGEDGRSYDCRLLGVFAFDRKDYALLQRLGADNDNGHDNGSATVIMQFVEKDDQAVFRTIETEEEFDRVVAYVKSLVPETSPQ